LRNNLNKTFSLNVTSHSNLPSTTTPSPKFSEHTIEPNYLRLVEETTRSHLQQQNAAEVTTNPTFISTAKEPAVSTPLQINLEFRNEEELSDISQSAQVKTCEDLLKAGFLDNKVYTVEIPQDARTSQGPNHNIGHDFRHRLCDQQTSGGGWTVTINKNVRLCYLLVLVYHVLL
jgi:hypothetical protein